MSNFTFSRGMPEEWDDWKEIEDKLPPKIKNSLKADIRTKERVFYKK